MRILQVHDRYRFAGGEDAAVAGEAAALQQAGHDVPSFTSGNPERLLPAATKFVRAPWNTRVAEQIVEAASRCRPDVAHVHNTWFALSPAVITGLHEHGIPS